MGSQAEPGNRIAPATKRISKRVVPAKAGIYNLLYLLDSRLRGNDMGDQNTPFMDGHEAMEGKKGKILFVEDDQVDLPAFERLAKHQRHLEELVEERTAKLTEANKHLLKMINKHLQLEKALRRSTKELKVSNRISEIFLTLPYDEIYAEILHVILQAMESQYGTFGFFEENGNFAVPHMIREIYWEKCNVPDKDIISPRGKYGGIWGRAVKEKKTLYSNNGPFIIPQGHIPIKNTMVAPVIYRDEIISVIHVANKVTGYDEKDKVLLETIADHVAPVLNARLQKAREEKGRKQAEEELDKHRRHLQELVKERTAKLTEVNENLRQEISGRKQMEGKLRTYQNQLRSLASELSLAEEKERRRISVGLHDCIGQNLYVSKIKLESLIGSAPSSELGDSIREVVDNIEQTIHYARTLTFELSPPVLYELGFESALENLTEQIYEQHGISSCFEDDRQSKPLDDEVGILLYQSVRELLNNVVKHARASSVTVSVKKEGTNIQIDVNDDGVGFDPSQINYHIGKDGGFGLFSIRERLDYMGGSLKLESKPGHGTGIRLVTPLTRIIRAKTDGGST